MKEINEDSLWLSFRVDGLDYCIQSDYIKSIMVPKKIEKVAKSPATVAGIILTGEQLVSVIEMRELLGSLNLKDYIARFSTMKNMHIDWVADLDRYVHEGGAFTKALDPHQCLFGKWYDGFSSDNARLNRLLKKIAVPHANIHKCGADIMRMRAEGADEALVEARLAEADRICKEDIVPLLDKLIDIYQTINRGVILIVHDKDRDMGLLVDEVRVLTPCKNVKRHKVVDGIMHCNFVGDAVVDGEVVMLEIKADNMLRMPEFENISQV